MANEIAKLFVALGLEDREFQSSMKNVQKGMKEAGKMMTGIGVGITAVMGLSVKAAADEQVGIEKLKTSINTLGESYADVAGGLEGWINKQQQATAFAGSEMREALAELVPVTGSLAKSQEALSVAMDLARWKGMDLGAASEIVGKVMNGNTGVLTRYGITLKEGATATEALAALQGMAAGQAETYGKTMTGQLSTMKNNMDDVMASIGSMLIPVLAELVKSIMPVIEGIKQWMADNPELAKTIVIIVAAVGALFAILGPILLILPTLAAGFTLMLGPVGLIILAIAALIAVGVLLWKNWDTIKAKLGEFWKGVKDVFKEGINFLIGLAEAWVNIYINAINFIIGALNRIHFEIPDWVPGIGGNKYGINIPAVPTIALPRLAAGGIVDSPTLAMIGESGPEAVIPLNHMGGAGGISVTINNPIVLDDRYIDVMAEQLVSAIRLKTGVHI